MEYLPVVLLCRVLLERRSRIRDGHKMASGLVRTNRVGDALEEIVAQHVGFGRAAGFARDDEKRLAEIEAGFERHDLRGHGRIENAQARPAAPLAECFRKNFRAETRSAHAEQDRVLKSLALYVLCKRGEACEFGVARAIQPAEPAVFVRTGPQRFIALPKFSYVAVRAPILGDFNGAFFEMSPVRGFAGRSGGRECRSVSGQRRQGACRRRRRKAARPL